MHGAVHAGSPGMGRSPDHIHAVPQELLSADAGEFPLSLYPTAPAAGAGVVDGVGEQKVVGSTIGLSDLAPSENDMGGFSAKAHDRQLKTYGGDTYGAAAACSCLQQSTVSIMCLLVVHVLI